MFGTRTRAAGPWYTGCVRTCARVLTVWWCGVWRGCMWLCSWEGPGTLWGWIKHWGPHADNPLLCSIITGVLFTFTVGWSLTIVGARAAYHA